MCVNSLDYYQRAIVQCCEKEDLRIGTNVPRRPLLLDGVEIKALLMSGSYKSRQVRKRERVL